jgi:high-affinity iron transporter
MAAFLLSLREGLEGVLIVSILLVTLRRLGRGHLARYVWLGTGVAVVASLALAVGLRLAGAELTGQTEPIFEGVTMLLAAAMLTWMIFWMQREGSHVRAALSAGVAQAVNTSPHAVDGLDAGRMALFAIACLAVVREGVELALLLVAAAFNAGTASVLIGTALGLAAAVALGVLLSAGVVRLDLKRFFSISGVLLLAFAAGMVALSMHELVEAAVLPGLVDPVWNLTAVLPANSVLGQLLKTLFGYDPAPSLTAILAYAGYLVAVVWALRLKRIPARVAPARV